MMKAPIVPTMCPPAPAHYLLSPEPQFYHRHQALTRAEFDREGEAHTSRLAFSDRNYLQFAQKVSFRRNTPDWALSREATKGVILEMWLRRLYSHPNARKKFLATHKSLVPLQLLAAIQTQLLFKCEDWIGQLDKLCHEFVKATDPARRQALQSQIRILDSKILLTKRGPQILASLFYQSYCLGYDACSVGQSLHMTGVAIRQILHRACMIAAEISGEKFKPRCWGGRRRRPESERTAAGNDAAE